MDSASSFTDTQFNKLMQKRIQSVLLISSSYDAFLLEEDGRIEEQIFNEYVSLNLRYPPRFIQVTNAEDALRIVQNEPIDLIISMLSVGGMNPFCLAKQIKNDYPDIPIVVLTPFSREVSIKLSQEDTSAIDYVFCWLGNADILVAIIKLIEDEMNAAHDILTVGVQCILLVEDSIRYYSSYLPIIYRIVFNQSKKFMSEALNEHQKMMRMRGRPKILLARNYTEAVHLYKKYRANLLGVISDVTFTKNNEKYNHAGIELAEMVKKDDPYMPFLLQSSDISVAEVAKSIRVGFLHKYSKSLLQELKQFLKIYLAFGDFIFTDPVTQCEVGRVSNLKQLQEQLFVLPDDSLRYHFQRDHVSKWLKARALFAISDVIKSLSVDDFESLEATKQFIYDTIVNFRISKNRGVIATFDIKNYDRLVKFARIGEGSIGGKARGLAFLNTVLSKKADYLYFDNLDITIPRTVVIATDVFEQFMESNNLYQIALSDKSDEEILDCFVQSKLPPKAHLYLRKFISVIDNPIAIRSSSVLEDSHYQPFAGIYSTYMVSNTDEVEVVLKQISDAIKCVYASVYFKSSKAYMRATMNIIDEEKMGIVLQEVVGQQHNNRFYPTISGVARSINFYPIAPEKTEDGIVNVALGLGKQIVEGGTSLRFSPKYPKKALQLSSTEFTIKDTQKEFFALDMDNTTFKPSVNDGINLQRLSIRTALKDGSLKWLGSVFDHQNNIIRDGVGREGIPLVTFANILKHDALPLASMLQRLLELGQDKMNQPVEIEFAVDLQIPNAKPIFYLLQIRPIVELEEAIGEEVESLDPAKQLIYSTSALGNGVINDICDVVFVKTNGFSAANMINMVPVIEKINSTLLEKDTNYILIGPGRWGSQDPWLGVPVKWAQISGARLIVETAMDGFSVDPSQGTHFFQNLTSLRVGYLTVNRFAGSDYYNESLLLQQPAVYEDEWIKHVRFSKPLLVKINGKKGLASVSNPLF
ncbi:Response regulator receiver domain-containing protein [Saccharicrinis carchari]|uniref:Response regulator receiver domain-containing protein n=1 Tax=Saccharicrinis carchari TaxID=1168039 RepID=A0A521DTP6_SACCC|nr:PEP/pyruvate-binding domain-containing protein [Saccharicrinis carchari]SMO74481.1 Response regulator receiver domain-containing protein [Saccharicrinis carchari]